MLKALPEWRPIAGFRNYSISEEGDVRNEDTGRILKPFISWQGYRIFTLSDNNFTIKLRGNVLVAEAFIPNPDNLPEVNHKDENKANDHKDNLEWMTRQQNAEYSQAKHYDLITPSGESVHVFKLRKFCRENGLCSTCMNHLVNGKQKQHKGWTLNKEVN